MKTPVSPAANRSLDDIVHLYLPTLDSNTHWPTYPLDEDLEIRDCLHDIDHFLHTTKAADEKEAQELELAKKLSLSPEFDAVSGFPPNLPITQPFASSSTYIGESPSEAASSQAFSSSFSPLALPPTASAISASFALPPTACRAVKAKAKPAITKQMSDLWFRTYQDNTAGPSKKLKATRAPLRKFMLVFWDNVSA